MSKKGDFYKFCGVLRIYELYLICQSRMEDDLPPPLAPPTALWVFFLLEPVEQTRQKSAYQSLLEAATMQSVPKISLYLSIIFFLIFPNLTRVKSQICKTNGGPSSFQKCVIPFKWNGKTYNKCPPDIEKPEKYWCSTKVDTNGVHIPKIGMTFSTIIWLKPVQCTIWFSCRFQTPNSVF